MSMQAIVNQENIVVTKSLRRSWTVEETNEFLEALSNLPGNEGVILNPYDDGLLIPAFDTVSIPDTRNRSLYSPNPVETLLRSDIKGVKSCHSLSPAGQGIRAGNLGYLANPNWGTLWICKDGTKAELEYRSDSFHSRFSKYMTNAPQPLATINFYICEEQQTVYLSRIYGDVNEVPDKVVAFIKKMFLDYGYKTGFFAKWWGERMAGTILRLAVYDKAQIVTKKPNANACYIPARYQDLSFYSALGFDKVCYCQESNDVILPGTKVRISLEHTSLHATSVADLRLPTTVICQSCGFTSSEINPLSYFFADRCQHCVGEAPLLCLFDIPLLEEMAANQGRTYVRNLYVYIDFDKQGNIRLTQMDQPLVKDGCVKIRFGSYRDILCDAIFSPALSKALEAKTKFIWGLPLNDDYRAEAWAALSELLIEK